MFYWNLWFTLAISVKTHDSSDWVSTTPFREREFKVTIKFVGITSMVQLREFLAGKQVDTPHEIIRIFDIVLNQLAAQRYISIVQLYFIAFLLGFN